MADASPPPVSDAMDEEPPPPPPPINAADVTLDVGHLAAFAPPTLTPLTTEADMAAAAAAGVAPLVAALFALPTEPSSLGGRLVALPPPSTVLPRALPPLTAAPLTKWQAFAKSKGITKKKRDRMVWDEASRSFKVRWGYKRAEANPEPLVVAHQPGMGTEEGPQPFGDRKAAARAAVAKNTQQRDANARRAGRAVAAAAAVATAAGAGGGGASSRKGKAPKGGRRSKGGGASVTDALTALDVGTTVKQTVTKRGAVRPAGRYVDKAALAATVAVSQRATASAGRFDRRVEGEKVAPVRGKKRKFEPAVAGTAALREERSRALGLADKILAGY